MKQSPGNIRIPDSWAGKITVVFLIAAFSLLLTAATDGNWHSYFLPSLPLLGAALLFTVGILAKYKLPSLGWSGWLALSGAIYFLLRAWCGDSLYDNWSDASLIFSGVAFYVLGFFMGTSRKEDRLLFWVVAFFLISCSATLLLQQMTRNGFTVLRPDFNIYLNEVGNVGFFGYKNFTGHFLVAGGFFSIGYFVIRGLRAWPWLIAGLISIAASFWCGSRAVYLNVCLGLLVCWIIYLCKIYRNHRKFIICSATGLFAILFITMGAFLFLSQSNSVLSSLSSFWVSGGRFQLTSLAMEHAGQAPLFGHGPLSFENNVVPDFNQIPASPNMAHNEYAQCAHDYGFTGFAILLAVLGVHIVRGFRLMARSQGDNSPVSARIAGALIVIVIASMHASMEFIWHNGAIVAMGAFCAGIISAGSPDARKASRKTENYLLASLSLAGCIFFAVTAFYSYPVWRNGWKMNSASSTERLAIVKETMDLTCDPDITNAYAASLVSQYMQRGNVSLNDLGYVEQALRKSLEKSPHDYMAQTYLGIVLSLQGHFEEADRHLYPFTVPGKYSEKIFTWRLFYSTHLASWAETTIDENPGRSLSLLKEALEVHSRTIFDKKLSHKKRKEIKDKLTMEITILEYHEIVPDDSWKEWRNQ